MATNTNYSNLKTEESTFAKAVKEFGVVTVMNARVYDADPKVLAEGETAQSIQTALSTKPAIAVIDSLKIANVTIEGPSKTVSGGRYSNPLIKFGKSARLEMQDALGRADVLEAFGSMVNEHTTSVTGDIVAMHTTEDFASPKTIVGETFIIDRKTGKQQKVDIIFYQFLPDSIFNLTQDAEGDATVFDMNGDLLTTEIKIGIEGSDESAVQHGVFYSILDHVKYAPAP